MSTPTTRLSRTLPIPQLIAEPSASTNPTARRSPPIVSAIRPSPMNASTMPAICPRRGRSDEATATKRIVKNAWVWTTIEARPGGMPFAMAKNCIRNWPAKRVRPSGTRARHARGRAHQIAGVAAIRNLSVVSWGGEKLSRPTRVTTNANPQMTATSTARRASAGLMRQEYTPACSASRRSPAWRM